MLTANRDYIEIVVSSLSQETGIKTEQGKNWAFDVKNRVLIYDPLDLISRPFYEVRGLILHEMGHVMYTEEAEPTQLFKDKPRIQEVYNALEDKRIEYLLKSKFGGLAQDSIEQMNSNLLENVLVKENIQKADPLSQVMLVLSGLMEKEAVGNPYMYYSNSVEITKNNFISTEAKEVLDEMFRNDNFFYKN